MGTPLVSLKNVTVRFGQYDALDGIDFTAHEGEIIAIIGPNGSGKSTLLKTILGEIIPSEGDVSVLPKKIGYVPQRMQFDRTLPMTVGEFITLYSEIDKARAKSYLEEVNMEDKIQERIGVLSGGQMQRVLIANALAMESPLLLLDEATAGVDVRGEEGFYQMINRLHKRHGMCTIMVSHDIHMVNVHATSIHCLNRSFLCHGSAEDITEHEAYKTLFHQDVGEYHHSCKH